MQLVSGSFKAQNAAMYFGLGFIPDFVKCWGLTTDVSPMGVWSINSRSLQAIEGEMRSTMTDVDMLDLAIGEGFAIYRGGTKTTASSTPSSTTYVQDMADKDKRDAHTSVEAISKWTLGSSTNKTGRWHNDCNTTYVGVGSRICVDGKWATVTALSNEGADANEVTLNEALKSGEIQFLSNMYDFVAPAAGTVTKEGFILSDTTYLLDATDYMYFEAGTYR